MTVRDRLRMNSREEEPTEVVETELTNARMNVSLGSSRRAPTASRHSYEGYSISLELGTLVSSDWGVGRVIAEFEPGYDRRQSWFWRPSWLAGEIEASRERASGAGEVYENSEDFLDSLDD